MFGRMHHWIYLGLVLSVLQWIIILEVSNSPGHLNVLSYVSLVSSNLLSFLVFTYFHDPESSEDYWTDNL